LSFELGLFSDVSTKVTLKSHQAPLKCTEGSINRSWTPPSTLEGMGATQQSVFDDTVADIRNYLEEDCIRMGGLIDV
jgi:hypothetical protein